MSTRTDALHGSTRHGVGRDLRDPREAWRSHRRAFDVFVAVVWAKPSWFPSSCPSCSVAKPPSCPSRREHHPRNEEAVRGETAEPLARAELRTPGNRAPLVPCRCRADYGRLERPPPGVALPTQLVRRSRITGTRVGAMNRGARFPARCVGVLRRRTPAPHRPRLARRARLRACCVQNW